MRILKNGLEQVKNKITNMKKFKTVVIMFIGLNIIIQLSGCDRKVATPDIKPSPSQIDTTINLTEQKIGWPIGVSITFSAGHANCGPAYQEACPDITCSPYVCPVPCHIPCINYGNACSYTIHIGAGVPNVNNSHYDGHPIYNNFNFEADSLFVGIGANGPASPWKNTWQPFSIAPSTSGHTKFINIPSQTTSLKLTSDGGEYYVFKNVTYTSRATFSKVY